MRETLETKKIYLKLFLLFLGSYGIFFQGGGGGNQNSRITLTQAIIHGRTSQIDNYLEKDDRLPGFKFV